MLSTSSYLLNVCRLNLTVGNPLKASSLLTKASLGKLILRRTTVPVLNMRYHSISTQQSTTSSLEMESRHHHQQQQKNVKFGLYGLGLVLGSFIGYQNLTHPTYNDAAMVTATNDGVGLKVAEPFHLEPPKETHQKRKAIYKQMCLGSVLGIGSAIVMAKISSLLIYLTVFTLLAFEWLRSRGIIDVKGSQLLQIGTTQSKSLIKRIKIEEMNMFKLSFLSTLLLTYANCG
ncbi:hypothetical protein MOUN0_F05710 [Monosporozyma unispora]